MDYKPTTHCPGCEELEREIDRLRTTRDLIHWQKRMDQHESSDEHVKRSNRHA